MVERKLFKTKLCVLYQRGHCGRQSCSFAHGEAELRRCSGSFNGRRPSRNNDLRDRLDRGRFSPQHKYSPGRDSRGRHAFHGHSPPRSLVKRRKYSNRHHDSQSEFSGSLRTSDGTDDRGKEEKLASSDSKDLRRYQVKELKIDVDLLIDQKQQLVVELEERNHEVDILSSRIQDLDSQLSHEKETCKKVTSKIKKFIRAHNNYSHLQDELKRSQVRLDKLVDDFSFNTTQLLNEEDSNVNVISDAETAANHLTNRLVESTENVSPAKRKFYINLDTELSKSVKLAKRRHVIEDKEPFLRNTLDIELNNKFSVVGNKRQAIDGPLANEGKAKRRKDYWKGYAFSDKMNLAAPPTSMAGHATNDFNELLEMEETETAEVKGHLASVAENGTASDVVGVPLPLPPPPPVNKNSYKQFKGDVDVAGMEELVEVDIV